MGRNSLVGVVRDSAGGAGAGGGGGAPSGPAGGVLAGTYPNPDFASGPIGLVPTAIKTANYTAAGGDLVRANTSGGGFTVTLPNAPADRTIVAVDLVTAGNSLTVACAGTDVFNVAAGSTSKTLATAGQVLLLQYVATGGVWVVLIDVLRSLNDGVNTLLDTSVAGVVKVGVTPDVLALDSLGFRTGQFILNVECVTVAALPACTYSNGGGNNGVGATLTGNAVGALSNQDGHTPVAGEWILVDHQASAFQNGVYEVTTLGDAGTAFVLTRVAQADAAADLASGLYVFIEQGTVHAGKIRRLKAATFTVGTTPQFFGAPLSLGDMIHGPRRDRYVVDEDFDTFDVALGLTDTGKRFPGTNVQVLFVGTGSQASQIETTDAVNGAIDLATGTTTTGLAVMKLSTLGITYDSAARWEMFVKVKTPILSDGTQTFGVKVGFISGTDGAPTDGVYFQARSGITNWEAVCRASSTETVVDTGVAQTTLYKNLQIIAPGNGHVFFYSAGVQVADISTNIPAVALGPQAHILKAAGTTSRSLRIDLMSIDIPNPRGNLLVP